MFYSIILNMTLTPWLRRQKLNCFEMDRLYKLLEEDSVPFVDGHCEVCNQSNVKIRPLLCGKHNYCRMCQEFVPRLVKGDFSCTKCSNRYEMCPS